MNPAEASLDSAYDFAIHKQSYTNKIPYPMAFDFTRVLNFFPAGALDLEVPIRPGIFIYRMRLIIVFLVFESILSLVIGSYKKKSSFLWLNRYSRLVIGS